jgi:hypothetical protein
MGEAEHNIEQESRLSIIALLNVDADCGLSNKLYGCMACLHRLARVEEITAFEGSI